MQERRAGAGRRGTAGQAQRAVELAETLGAPFHGWATVQPSCAAVPVARSTVGCGWDLCVRAVWRGWGGYIGHSHVMLRVMMGMRQWGLRRFPPRDARERSREPGRELAGGRGVVSRACLHSESRPGRANGTYWLSLIGWSVPETVYVSGRRGVPRGHMISNLVGTLSSTV